MQLLLKHKALLLSAAFSLSSVGTALAAGPLAAMPAPGNYMSPMRILLIAIMIVPWLMFCSWVDSDCEFLRKQQMKREVWNPIVLGGGLLGIALWLFMPWKTTGLFAAGFGLWLFVTFSTCAVYVVVRNGKVDRGARVFTARHIKAKFSNMGKKKEIKFDAVERVRMNDHAGKKVPPPSDPGQMDAFDAAQELLFDCFWRRATEVKLIVSGKGMGLSYTIDGVASSRNDLLDRDAAIAAMNYIKELAGLDVAERRRPQTGQVGGAIIGVGKGTTDVEVKTSGTTKGELMRLRIVAQDTRLRISDLGMLEPQTEKLEAIVHAGPGLVLVSGPKANGLTTTLYGLLRTHDSFMYNLLTIEKSPLMELENVTQHIFQDGEHQPSYARQFQTVLRREPDVVLVSDCEDRETAHLAAQSASDGKKIYMGIQARDSFDALKKLLSLAGDMDLVANSLQAVTSQRLVRKLCKACRQAYKPNQQLLKKANLPVDKIEHFYRPPAEDAVDEKGNPLPQCPNCQGSGYYGRTGVFETLVIDDAMRELIRKGQPVSAINTQARKVGMLYLDDVGLRKVMDGTTSMAEVLRALRNDDGKTPRKTEAPRPKPAAG